MKNFFAILALFAAFCMSAQDISQSLITEPAAYLCKPGVTNKSPGRGLTLDYQIQPRYNMHPPEVTTSSRIRGNERFNFKLKIPVINMEGFKLLVGVQYFMERHKFSEINPNNFPFFERLDGVDLKIARLAIYAAKPLSHKFYASVRVGVSYAGDYSGLVKLRERYATYRAAAMFGVKKNKDLEYGFGALISNSFRRTLFIPFGFYNHTFSDRWGVEAAIPMRVMGRYNLNEKNMLLFGSEFISKSYSMDVQEDVLSLVHYRRSSFENSVSILHKLSQWTWLQFKFGYVQNIKSKVRNVTTDETSRYAPTNGVFGLISFFVSPPKHDCEEEDIKHDY